MDKDYENFVGRMGSFEDVIDLDDEEIPIKLEHSGKTFVNSTLEIMGDVIMFDF